MGEIEELAELGVHFNYSELFADICDQHVEERGTASQVLQSIETLNGLVYLLAQSRKGKLEYAKIHDFLAESLITLIELSMLFGESQVSDVVDLKLKRYSWNNLKNEKSRGN